MSNAVTVAESNIVYLNKARQPVTTSRRIAEVFGKQHKNVIRNIEALDCSKEFTGLNFELSEYCDTTGKSNKQYELTRDGMVFLVMGFTGQDAAKFKEAYIIAFNDMEARLLSQNQTLPQSASSIDEMIARMLDDKFAAIVSKLAPTLELATTTHQYLTTTHNNNIALVDAKIQNLQSRCSAITHRMNYIDSKLATIHQLPASRQPPTPKTNFFGYRTSKQLVDQCPDLVAAALIWAQDKPGKQFDSITPRRLTMYLKAVQNVLPVRFQIPNAEFPQKGFHTSVISKILGEL